MVDIHSHILPGIDDGPATADFSVAMAHAAAEAGTQIVVATPHIRGDRPVRSERIESLVDDLNSRLLEERLPLRILPAGEIAWSLLPDLPNEELSRLCLGSSRYLLVEAPHGRRPADIEGVFENAVNRGFKVIFAHPERAPLFQSDGNRLADLVDRGALCSITAASIMGRFGERAQSFALELLARGLVHDVASDSHDHLHRPPGLLDAFDEAERVLPGIRERSAWYTTTAPVAILSGRPLPPAPHVSTVKRGLLHRWRKR